MKAVASCAARPSSQRSFSGGLAGTKPPRTPSADEPPVPVQQVERREVEIAVDADDRAKVGLISVQFARQSHSQRTPACPRPTTSNRRLDLGFLRDLRREQLGDRLRVGFGETGGILRDAEWHGEPLDASLIRFQLADRLDESARGETVIRFTPNRPRFEDASRAVLRGCACRRRYGMRLDAADPARTSAAAASALGPTGVRAPRATTLIRSRGEFRLCHAHAITVQFMRGSVGWKRPSLRFHQSAEDSR